MPYIGVSPQFGVRRKHTYTATAGQTDRDWETTPLVSLEN